MQVEDMNAKIEEKAYENDHAYYVTEPKWGPVEIGDHMWVEPSDKNNDWLPSAQPHDNIDVSATKLMYAKKVGF